MGRGTLTTPWVAQNHLWLRAALSENDVEMLRSVGGVKGAAGRRLSSDGATTKAIKPVVKAVTQHFDGFYPVRMVSFSKTTDANWQVPWHQDRVIAVRDRADVSGFTNWSLKSGQWHCEPPSDTLQHMLFVRVFLDSCDAQTGGMEFAMGSHADGIVPAAHVATHAAAYPCQIENAASGDILILPMLTLHRSVPAQVPSGRHILRFDFAKFDLPNPLNWVDFAGDTA